MSGQIVAMGQGWSVMNSPSDPLHQYVLGLASVPRPRVGFLPTASGDDAGYIVSFYETYNAEICVPSHLKLFLRKVVDVHAWVMAQDIIHVGGGSTGTMLAAWRLHGIDVALRDAWDAGKVLCGGSAGALCWFDGGVTSLCLGQYQPFTDGLGLIPASMCPHYDSEPKRAPAYHEFVRNGSLGSGYAADDRAALHFDGDRLLRAVSSRSTSKAYRVDADKGAVTQTELATEQL